MRSQELWELMREGVRGTRILLCSHHPVSRNTSILRWIRLCTRRAIDEEEGV
jgi:hypothetical protein